MSLPILNDQQKLPDDTQIDTERILARTKVTELRESPLKNSHAYMKRSLAQSQDKKRFIIAKKSRW